MPSLLHVHAHVPIILTEPAQLTPTRSRLFLKKYAQYNLAAGDTFMSEFKQVADASVT